MNSPVRVTKTRLHAGVWEGILDLEGGATPPPIEVVHLETPLEGVSLAADPALPGRFTLSVPIPSVLLSDGVQTFLIRDVERDETLGSFAILTGVPLEEDIRAEVDLLRAELDMLKKAFRRHCLEMTQS
ncbi:MAG: hypothetical protein JXJ18_13160 [Rhodobacteraceae bacterium]|nr:hypothetical protein [Paracoccaceae bacterium]